MVGEHDPRAWAIAAAVPDPELPFITIEDLGILRYARRDEDRLHIGLSPTYTGCPAVLAIEMDVEMTLLNAGINAKIDRVMHPAWTSDWITPRGRKKLRAHGIAPPVAGGKGALFGAATPTCPQCDSAKVTRLSEFGSTACKAQYRCDSCREPFDYFKCI